MNKVFTVIVIVSAVVYAIILYYVLFGLTARQMVVVSEDMLENYNYWNAVNLIPLKTISEYFTAASGESTGGHAIRNLAGNLFLMFPLGFYLLFFVRKLHKFWTYCIITASAIIIVEVVQVLTMTGSLDIDDFILNFAGALLGFFVFTHTRAKKLFGLRAW